MNRTIAIGTMTTLLVLGVGTALGFDRLRRDSNGGDQWIVPVVMAPVPDCWARGGKADIPIGVRTSYDRGANLGSSSQDIPPFPPAKPGPQDCADQDPGAGVAGLRL
jgi:hypothetical protein